MNTSVYIKLYLCLRFILIHIFSTLSSVPTYFLLYCIIIYKSIQALLELDREYTF